MPVGAGLGLALGYGPQGMWTGLIAGLLVAATLMAGRFLRSSRRVPMVAGAAQVMVTNDA
jgi:MATE family multidrug resistance protein